MQLLAGGVACSAREAHDPRPTSRRSRAMPQHPTCAKCRGSMEKGVIPDMGYGRVFITHWQAGRATGPLGGLRQRAQTRYEIAAYRCVKCGYLECYANDEKSW